MRAGRAVRGLAVAVAVGAMLAACGQQVANPKLIGVRPGGDVTTAAAFDAGAISDELSSQISEANDVGAIPGETKLANGELPIDSTLTLTQSERLSALQQLGTEVIKERLDAISNVRKRVWADPHISSYEKGIISTRLDNASAGLNSMQVTLARDLLVDAARADVTRVAAFRVYGLLLPQAHLLVAAYEMRELALTYSTEQADLQRHLNSAPAGANGAGAQAEINDLAAQIGVMNGASWAALGLLQTVSPSGYASSRQVFKNVRNTLLAGQAANVRAAGDAAVARVDLGI